MFKKLLVRWHTKRMTELGKELAEAMVNDAWSRSEHRLTHKKSGVAFWISNGYTHFKLHDVSALTISESRLQEMLNSHDRYVIWHLFQKRLRNVPTENVQAVLNLLRLKRQTGDQP